MESESLYMAMENTNFCCLWRGVESPLIACSNATWEAVVLCGAIMRFVGETLAPEGDSTCHCLVGVSGNRVSSRSPMVLWEKTAKARGFAGV